MSDLHWFPLQVDRFLSSSKIALMNNEEVGAYMFLLCHEWNDPTCSLPTDEKSLQKLARYTGDFSRLIACFEVRNGRLVNTVLLAIKKEQLKKHRLRSQAGVKGSRKRWDSQANGRAIAMPIAKLSQSERDKELELESERELKTELEPENKEKIKTLSTAHAANVKKEAKSAQAWEAYKNAYYDRYRVEPERGAETNRDLCRVVDKVGRDSAPHVAAYFLTISLPFYVTNRHPTSLLGRDANSISTQWKTGIKATTGEAKNAEAKDDARAQVARVRALMQGGNHGLI